MKRFLIWLIHLYQAVPGPWHGACRYSPSCSHYAEEALQRFGTLRGCWLTLKRLLRCAPWGGEGYDPVPMTYPARRSGAKQIVPRKAKSSADKLDSLS